MQAIAQRAGRFTVNLKVNHCTVLLCLELLQLGFRHQSVRLVDCLQRFLMRLLHIFDLDAHLHSLGFRQFRCCTNLLLGKRDSQRAQGNHIVVITQFTFGLLNLRAPYTQFFFRLKQMLNFSVASLNHLQQSHFHGPRGTQTAFEICVLFSNVLTANLLDREFPERT